MERKYNDTDKLMKAGKFLESKGLDIREYTIFDTSGSFKQQIPIATWLTDFAILCGGKVETGDGQLTIPDVSNRRELLSNFADYVSKKYVLNIDIDDSDVDEFIKIAL